MNQLSKRYWTLCIYLLLALSTFVVFWQSRHHEFVRFDDDRYIYENDRVKAGLTTQGLAWAFTKAHAHNWHPLTWISHMLDCELYGLQPGGHHLTNILLHTANTLLLLMVLNRMTRSIWRSAFVAALFALHPLHVESVAWVSERKDLLSTFFGLLTIWAYIRYTERVRIGKYLLVLFFFALGLMSKPMLVTLPFVLLLLDYWPLGRLTFKKVCYANAIEKTPFASACRCILEKLPLFVLSAASSATTYLVQRYSGVVKSAVEFPLTYRIENAVVAYVAYIAKMLWPFKLAVFYPHLHENLPSWQIAAAALLLVSITVLVFYKATRRPYLLVGWLWYLGTLVPVIGLVQVGLQAFADRYTYIPLIGLFLAFAWGVPDLLARLSYRKAVLFPSAFVLLLVLALTAHSQAGHWRNTEALHRHAIAAVPNNWWAHNQLGSELFRLNKPDESVIHFEKALHSKPEKYYIHRVHLNLGIVLDRQGKSDEAITHFNEALRIKPDYAKAHNSLGITLQSKGRFDEAVSCFRRAVQEKPDYAEAHNNLGVTLRSKGLLDEAVAHFRRALKAKPDYAKAHNNLGSILQSTGQLDEAINHFRLALQAKPQFAEARFNLATALQSLGRLNDAADHYRQAIHVKPDYADAHNNFGVLLMSQGRAEEAASHFQQAAHANPDLAETHYNLAAALQSLGKIDEAVIQYRRALKIKPDYAEAHNNLGLILKSKGRLDDAISCFQQALLTESYFAEAHYNLAATLQSQGKLDDAVTHYRKLLQIKPNHLLSLNKLAWLLAVNPDPEKRDINQAIVLAGRAAELTNYQNPSVLRTLAVAYATAGRFEQAVTTAQKALDLATAQKNYKLADYFREQLKLYHMTKP